MGIEEREYYKNSMLPFQFGDKVQTRWTRNRAMNGSENSISTAATKKKKKPKRKCESGRECWGCCEFLRTSWRTFKEFSADTSIHGEFKC